MNYLAHGHRLLDRPWAVAGAALPDWLKMADRRGRVAMELLPLHGARGDGDDGDVARDVAAGLRAHEADDARFHDGVAFTEATDAVTADIRARFADDPDVGPAAGRRALRASFLAHILVEMLLDAELECLRPGTLARYYAALDAIDPARLARVVAPWLKVPAPRLPLVVTMFRSSRFLEGYETDHGVHARLSGLVRRMGMSPLPDAFVDVVRGARPIVRARSAAMLA